MPKLTSLIQEILIQTIKNNALVNISIQLKGKWLKYYQAEINEKAGDAANKAVKEAEARFKTEQQNKEKEFLNQNKYTSSQSSREIQQQKKEEQKERELLRQQQEEILHQHKMDKLRKNTCGQHRDEYRKKYEV